MFEPIWEEEQFERIDLMADAVGTPFYYFDVRRLNDNIDFIRNILPDSTRLCFSLKANPWVVKEAGKRADFVEVCSSGERRISEGAGIPGCKTVVGGVYKTEQELERLSNHPPFRVSVESLHQLELLSRYAVENGTEPEVLLRLSSGNQFGMSSVLIEEVFARRHRYPGVALQGIHYYSGTMKRRPEDVEKDFLNLEAVAGRIQEDSMEIEYGPGIGVSLFQANGAQVCRDCLEVLAKGIDRLSGRYIMTLEFGRLLTADIGVYVTTVVDQKTNDDQIFYIVDGGTHHLDYYGQVNGYPVPLIRQSRKRTENRERATVCGALCMAGDILARKAEIYPAQRGDRLMFLNAGAYCVTEAKPLFLSRRLPAVVVSDEEGVHTVRSHTDTAFLNTEEVFS